MLARFETTRGHLRVSGLRKELRGNQILKGIDLDISPGEFVSIVGPSGSGKTTLLSIISGTLEPTEGALWLDGADLATMPTRLREIGMVFQNYALFPHMSVLQNVRFSLDMRRVDKDVGNKKALELLERVRLGNLAARRPSELSGGQQQRVAIARALASDPRLLLFDEPLAALDKPERERMKWELKELQKAAGFTAIYVTHDQSEAMHMSDRIVILTDGKVAQVGSPQDIYQKPCSLEIAKFVGESNIIRASLVDSELIFPDGPTMRLTHLASSGKRPVVAVIRLGDAKLTDNESSDSFQGVITSQAFLGDEIVCEVTTDSGLKIKVRDSARTPRKVGGPANVSFSSDSIHVFEDSESGLRIPFVDNHLFRG